MNGNSTNSWFPSKTGSQIVPTTTNNSTTTTTSSSVLNLAKRADDETCSGGGVVVQFTAKYSLPLPQQPLRRLLVSRANSSKSTGLRNHHHHHHHHHRKGGSNSGRDEGYHHTMLLNGCNMSKNFVRCRMVDYVVLIGMDWDVSGSRAVGRIHQRFPSLDWPDAPFNEALVNFCQPTRWRDIDGNGGMVPSFKNFVLTGTDGYRQYCNCLMFGVGANGSTRETRRYLEKCLVIVSRFDYIEVHRQMLLQIIESIEKESSQQLLSIRSRQLDGGAKVAENAVAAILQEYELPQSIVETVSTGSSVYSFLSTVGIHPVMVAVSAAITEQKVVCVSRSVAQLSHACRAIRALIYPLKYNHVYVPLLTEDMLDIIDAPTPYIVGIRTCHYAYLVSKLKHNSSQDMMNFSATVVLDLDVAKLHVYPTGSALLMPCKNIRRTLIRDLLRVMKPRLFGANDDYNSSDREIEGRAECGCSHRNQEGNDGIVFSFKSIRQCSVQKLDKAIRACFLKSMVRLLSGYRSCLLIIRMNPQIALAFHNSRFATSRPCQRGRRRSVCCLRFVTRLLDSIGFHRFIEEKASFKSYRDVFDQAYDAQLSVEQISSKLLEAEVDACDASSFVLADGQQQQQRRLNQTPSSFPYLDTNAVGFALKDMEVCRPILTISPAEPTPKSGKHHSVNDDSTIMLPPASCDWIETQRVDIVNKYTGGLFSPDKRVTWSQIKSAIDAVTKDTQALKHTARIALCDRLDEAVRRNMSCLDSFQYAAIRELFRASLFSSDQKSMNDEYFTFFDHEIAVRILKLSMRFYKQDADSETGKQIFLYGSIRACKIWKDLKFWELAFFTDLQGQLVELYSSMENGGTVLDTNQLACVEVTRLAFRLVDHYARRDYSSIEESTISSLALHYIHQIGNIRFFNGMSEEEQSAIVRFMRRFIERVCDEALVSESCQNQLFEKLDESVQVLIEDVAEINETNEDFNRTQSAYDHQNKRPGQLTESENVIKVIEDVKLYGSQGFPGGFYEGSLPAHGSLVITNYRILFDGISLSDYVHVKIETFIPLSSLIRLKRLNDSSDDYAGQVFQLQSTTFEFMRIGLIECSDVLQQILIDQQRNARREWLNVVNKIHRKLEHSDDTFKLTTANTEQKHSLKRIAKSVFRKTGETNNFRQADEIRVNLHPSSSPPSTSMSVGTESNEADEFASIDMDDSSYMSLTRSVKFAMSTFDRFNRDGDTPPLNRFAHVCFKNGRLPRIVWSNDAFVGKPRLTLFQSSNCTNALINAITDASQAVVMRGGRRRNSQSTLNALVQCIRIATVSSGYNGESNAANMDDQTSFSVLNTPILRRWYNSVERSTTPVDMELLSSISSMSSTNTASSPHQIRSSVLMSRFVGGECRQDKVDRENQITMDDDSRNISSLKLARRILMKRLTRGRKSLVQPNETDSVARLMSCKSFACLPAEHRASSWTNNPSNEEANNIQHSGNTIYVLTDRASVFRRSRENGSPNSKNGKFVIVPLQVFSFKQIRSSFRSLVNACVSSKSATNDDHLLTQIYESGWLDQTTSLLTACVHVCRGIIEHHNDCSTGEDDSLSEDNTRFSILVALDNTNDMQHSSSMIAQSNSPDVRRNDANSDTNQIDTSEKKNKAVVYQILSLLQLMVDPFTRTMSGFIGLLEKHWIFSDNQLKHQKLFTSTMHFIQFIDCVYQLMDQFPLSFEFNEDLLRFLVYHSCSGRFYNLTSYHFAHGSQAEGDVIKYLNSLNSTSFRFFNTLYDSSYHSDSQILVPDCSPVSLSIWQYYLSGDLDHRDRQPNGSRNQVTDLLEQLYSLKQRQLRAIGATVNGHDRVSFQYVLSQLNDPNDECCCMKIGLNQQHSNTSDIIFSDSLKTSDDASSVRTNTNESSFSQTADRIQSSFEAKNSVSSIGSAFDVFNNVTSLSCLKETRESFNLTPCNSPFDNDFAGSSAHDNTYSNVVTSSTVSTLNMERTGGAEQHFCVFEGLLKKRSINSNGNTNILNLKQWKQRWLVLDDVRNELRYYEDQPSSQQSKANCAPRGRIPLSTVVMVRQVGSGDEGKSFEVHTKGKIHIFASPSSETTTLWIENIRRCLGEN